MRSLLAVILAGAVALQDRVDEQLNKLKSDKVDEQLAALKELGRLDVKRQIAQLLPLLKSPDVQVRGRAAEILAYQGGAALLPALEEMVKEGEPDHRAKVVRLISVIGGKDQIPRLTELLRDKEIAVRVAAATGLCSLGASRGGRFLLEEAPSDAKAFLVYLNAFKQPAVWAKLKGELIEEDADFIDVTLEALVGRLTMMNVECSEKAASQIGGEGSKISMKLQARRGRSRLDLLLGCAHLKAGGISFNIVLEEDRVRIIRDFEAPEFWKGWWAKARLKE